MYRMRIFAPNQVVAKSRFWYFLSKYHKMKKTTGEILSVNEIFEKNPNSVKILVLLLDMIVDLVLITFTKNIVILLVLVLLINFIWIWLEDTELDQEVSKLLMLNNLLLRIVRDHMLLNSMILVFVSHFHTEFKEQAKSVIKEDSEHLVHLL